MSQKYEKLKALLKELFQLDQPELDFGIYRILHARSAEVTQFLDKDLLPQVEQAFAQYRTADKVKDLRARLASDAVDTGALEAEVYDHLYSFFRRYYSEGDFLSKRVYKPGVYAIPYEGEEVKLHWANADQYYIKTSESFRDYAFRLRPEDEANPMRVHFKLADADEKYGLNWHGKRRARQLALTPSTGTLRPCPEDSVDWDTTQNLMIEGDNLEVLKLLQKSYAGKVKLIYIDPPYNTGKDFIYRDDFRDNIRNYHRLTGQVKEDGSPLTSNTAIQRPRPELSRDHAPRARGRQTEDRTDGAFWGDGGVARA